MNRKRLAGAAGFHSGMNMTRLLRILSFACLALGLGLLALSAYLYWDHVDGQRVPFVVEQPIREFSSVEPESRTIVEYPITNTSRRTIRVVGAEYT
jgi:hypothetical protein